MTAPPYPAKGTTDWYEPLHDYTEGIRDEADDKLAMKADTASLGTAAFANTGDFATASQGAKADSAVQPADVAGVIADRHTHANKATLDGIGSANLVPAPGVRGQVLTIGASGREWGEVPGALRPDLLLAPTGSYSELEPITPTVAAGVEVLLAGGVPAWSIWEATTNLASQGLSVGNAAAITTDIIDPTIPGGTYKRAARAVELGDYGTTYATFMPSGTFAEGPEAKATVSAWYWVEPGTASGISHQISLNGSGTNYNFWPLTVSVARLRYVKTFDTGGGGTWSIASSYLNRNWKAGDVFCVAARQLETKPYATPFTLTSRPQGTVSAPFAGSIAVLVIRYRDDSGIHTSLLTGPGTFGTYGTISLADGVLTIGTTRGIEVEGVAVWASDPGSRAIDAMLRHGGPYTQPLVPSYQIDTPSMVATNKTASGTTSLRTAPGAATTLIVALSANTFIQDTGGRVTESSVPYAQVIAVVGSGNVTGWIPVSQIAAL